MKRITIIEDDINSLKRYTSTVSGSTNLDYLGQIMAECLSKGDSYLNSTSELFIKKHTSLDYPSFVNQSQKYFSDKGVPNVSEQKQKLTDKYTKSYLAALGVMEDKGYDIKEVVFEIDKAQIYPIKLTKHDPLFGYFKKLFSQTDNSSFFVYGSFHETVETRLENGIVRLSINGLPILAYSPIDIPYCENREVIDKEDLQGCLLFENQFFIKPKNKRSKHSGSDMENIAKKFFTVNDKNHVALIQYLFENGFSKEHYHTLEETIVQLAGRTSIDLRLVESDTNLTTVSLEAGERFKIPPNTLHVLHAVGSGSITVPIKETDLLKSDHLIYNKSVARIEQEVEHIINGIHFNSGDEMQTALRNYYTNLTKIEKDRFNRKQK